MGYNYYGQLATDDNLNRPVPTLIVPNDVVAIAAGSDHSLFLKANGSLWGMGQASYGQLGDGFDINSYTAVQIEPRPQPVLTITAPSAVYVQLEATCLFGGKFGLLTHTNIAAQLAAWTQIQTVSVTNRGPNNFSITLTNELSPAHAQQFFMLESR
jgi:alpha-tubulin suppressor-like RCC1 family protein